MDLLMLAASLVIILASAELFTNGIEWLGLRLNLSQGAVGSVLAAVGTALPEAVIPIVAVLLTGGEHAVAIGVGAILGAPFMLGTLAFLVTGTAIIYYSWRRRRSLSIQVDREVIRRDLGFFLVVYGVAIAAAFLPDHRTKLPVAGFLVAAYAFYLYLTFTRRTSELSTDHVEPLFLAKRLPRPSLAVIGIQVVVALVLMVTGAHLFVGGVERIAESIGVAPFLLSLIIAPVATELPEKFNSVLWIGRSKDTLALGNITGAMVFQGSLIPALGILITPWTLNPLQFLTAILGLGSPALVYLYLRIRDRLSPQLLVSGGLVYIVYLFLVL